MRAAASSGSRLKPYQPWPRSPTLRDETDAGAEADARGERRGEGYRDERLDEPNLAREREAAVGGVWVARGGRVEERNVLGEPERMKTGSLGDGRGSGDHVAEPRWIAGQREEESELHGRRSCPGRRPAGKGVRRRRAPCMLDPAMRRVIDLEGCLNFRGLGGYPTAGGRTVRWQHGYRSDALDHVTPADVACVRYVVCIAAC